MGYKPSPIGERLRKRTKVTSGGCWEYDCKARNAFGHRVIRVGTRAANNVRNEFVHRVSWEQHRGPIPPGMCVLHRCDNPACINPDHLFLGTRADNTNDMLAKSREAYGSRLPQTKLSPAEVMAIRSSSLSNSEIAREYGMSDSTICVLRQGKIHKHVVG